MDTSDSEKPTVLEADTVYLLMKKGFPISRNVRAQWVLKHLDTTIEIQSPDTESADLPELEVASVIPKEGNHSWTTENAYQFLYRVTSSTTIKFFAHKYRIVFSLDLSPSLATVDIQHGEIVVDEVFLATKRCLEGLTKPFVFPGSNRVLTPEIYVTVIVHTPFFTNPAQQVLVQGWLVTMENIPSLMQIIESELNSLEEKVAQVTSLVNLQLETLRAESERLVGGLFEEGGTSINKNNTASSITTIAMVSPETGFVNTLRYGMLALSLLPEYSCAHLVIVTDGIVGVNDVHTLDSVIQQLRATTIACSFLHVGSSYHPHSGNGLVPYPDLLRFLATATLGSYMSVFPIPAFTEQKSMNTYHNNLLSWQLYRTEQIEVETPGPNAWRTKNSLFYGHEPPQLLRKKQIDDQVTCTLNSLLCCRLREGYLIKKTAIRDGCLEICFVLPWKTHVYIEYLVTCPRFLKSLSICNTLQYTITIEAPYEFLHDITCLSKKPLKSQYRQNMVSRFWLALTSLTENDGMLAHFSWFPSMKWTWYNVPDTIKSGMPLFYLSSTSTIQLSDAACPQFGHIWQPVVSLEPNQWSRWLHSQRITLVLIHDRPLSKHLHQANQSGRFQSVQYRQAAAVLYGMLKNWATFVLVDNHTYVQFIYKEADKPPISFSLINISSKSLCIVLNVAFAGGTDGSIRHAVMTDLLERLLQLTLPSRRTEQKEIPCCIIMHKPLEKILIRYERMPRDLNAVIFPDGSQIIARNASIAGGSVTTTLSRYLYHKRWLWLLKKPSLQTVPVISLPRLNIAAVARILATVTKIRLTEGFHFAYSAAGIINTVMEVQMKGPGSNNVTYPCIVQYILFPPHVVVNPGLLDKDSGSEEETDGTNDGECGIEDNESNGDFQIVMEVWIEPQCGNVQFTTTKKASYMHSLEYFELPEIISKIDRECINALLTLEHLSMMCQVSPLDKGADLLPGQQQQQQQQQQVVTPVNQSPIVNGSSNNSSNSNNGTNMGKASRRPTHGEIIENPLVDDRISSMQFDFDALGILPKCQQAELIFSMFSDDYNDHGGNTANRILMEGLLNHIKSIHNRELVLSPAESNRFTMMLASRPREEGARNLFSNNEFDRLSKLSPYPRWRCFVKGISVTHVIVTLLPAGESDVHLMAHPDDEEVEEEEEDDRNVLATPVFDGQLQDCSTTSEHQIEISQSTGDASPIQRNRVETAESSDLEYLKTTFTFSTPKSTNAYEKAPTPSDSNSKRGLILPIYVYDCSLSLLIDSLIEKLERTRFKDIYRDHTFKVNEQYSEEFVNLKSGDNTKPSSPEPKSEDSDNVASDQKNLMDHCKVLSLAHCHSFVVAVYKSLILQQPLEYDDMDAAVEQCEECLIEVNITDYLRAVCKHFDCSDNCDESSCSEMRNVHNLIKDKFKKIINIAFKQVPVHPDFYYCLPPWKSDKLTDTMHQVSSDSDDDVRFTFASEGLNGKLNSLKKVSHIVWSGSGLHDRSKLSESSDSADSFISDLQLDPESTNEKPLFLQLNCSIHSKSSFSSTSVKLLPTCFTEITNKLDDYNIKDLSTSNLKVTLDIICLNLPKDVLEVSIDNSPNGLRTTSYCSEGSMRNGTETNDGIGLDRMQSFEAEHILETMSKLPGYQYSAVTNLVEEINWLLRDETAAVLLDKPSPTEETLNFVAKHVKESNNRSSCYLDKVPLHFVFPSESSLPKFMDELKKLTIDRYCIREEGNLFYFIKNKNTNVISLEDIDQSLKNLQKKDNNNKSCGDTSSVFYNDDGQSTSSKIKKQDSGDPPGCHSEISSIGDNQIGTDDGYEGDSSDSEDECQWLIDLDARRELLPNFWLILRVENNHVNIYFHCRFLELTSPEVDRYQQVQKTAVSQIKAICRKVNQFLLLRDLHDKRICDPLLEPESIEDHTWKNSENSTDTNLSSLPSYSNSSANSNTTPGMFRCPIVWEVPFCLHHRLKTGPGKTGLSRGIKALQAVLNRFSVNNRNNMFVYQENSGNVFYLRLQERTSDDRPLQSNKLSESDEKLMVSRSSSVASLSQAKSLVMSAEYTSTSTISTMDLLRPRVRSFGERESDILNKSGDSIVLMVHGISEAGPEVKCELVQVLQNRLDDAVLEVLSVMLARNPMCKLTPSDVHFIQRQYRAPESVIRLSVQERCFNHMGALGYYLRQNILQFLYTPKYTDVRTHSHFQDYSQPDGSSKRVPESDIFLYNQSQSSGSRGIACIAIAVVNEKGDIVVTENENVGAMLPYCPEIKDFEEIVSTSVYWNQSNDKTDEPKPPKAYIEFRIWKQGRVNLEALVHKLKSAVRHANWDLMTEYAFLPSSLAEPTSDDLEDNENAKSDPSKPDGYELGEKGKLKKIYYSTLPYWFQFALDLSAPSVKKHVVKLERRHSLLVILKELQNLVHSHALDTTARTFVQWSKQPFVDVGTTQDELLLSKNPDNVDPGSVRWLSKAIDNAEKAENLIFLSHEVSKEDSGIYVGSILIARNFNQWKASSSSSIKSEQLIPKDQKLLQKFNPLILEKTFVPRQRLLLAKVQSQHIIIYMYNWSKERSEKLTKQVTSLGLWLSSRSNLYSNIVMQKLGIFHHQPGRTYEQQDPSSSQFYQITDMESLAKFPNTPHTDGKEWQRASNRNQGKSGMGLSWTQLMGQVMRDAKPSGQYPPNVGDPVVRAAYDFQELRHKEKKYKDELNKLHTMWQSRSAAPNIPISMATLNTFMQYSRLIHYCHTPLLFLPSWRLQSAATRDHSLAPQPFHLTQNQLQQQRSRTTSDASNKRIVSEWHREICELVLSEYKQYLQVLGFNPVQLESQQKTKGVAVLSQAFYLKKSMLGGVLLFEIHMAEPFFVVKLRVIECNRLQAKSSSALVNQFMLSFVDVCDKVKISMHLHSFTYDFHLRCIHSYIAGTSQWSLKHGYHITNFLDDFNKYYSKAPNYARNLIHSDVVTVSNLIIPAHMLYQYLLSHEKTYGMQVFSMSDENDDTQSSEYVLVRLQSTPLVSYHDAQDTKYTDDFDIALIVTWLDQFAQPDTREITLKYYLMLTSKRELYPKREVESNNKIGKFRTVYSVVKSMASSQVDSPSESSPASTISPYLSKHSKNELTLNSSDLQHEVSKSAQDSHVAGSLGSLRECDGNLDSENPEIDVSSPAAPTPPPVPESPLATNILNASSNSTANLSQIRQESVNYLGYYNSHEQLMQQLIMSQASAAQQHIQEMVEQGAIHCRTHLLWNRLLEFRSSMTYAEFSELRSLACVEPLSAMDPRLSPLYNQPVNWYQGLAKVLQNKYQEYYKQFNAPDGSVTHHLILHPSYVQAFMMLTIDLHTSRGELFAVYRKSEEIVSTPFTMSDIYTLIEDFVNACCFHLWVGLYT